MIISVSNVCLLLDTNKIVHSHVLDKGVNISGQNWSFKILVKFVLYST